MVEDTPNNILLGVQIHLYNIRETTKAQLGKCVGVLNSERSRLHATSSSLSRSRPPQGPNNAVMTSDVVVVGRIADKVEVIKGIKRKRGQ